MLIKPIWTFDIPEELARMRAAKIEYNLDYEPEVFFPKEIAPNIFEFFGGNSHIFIYEYDKFSFWNTFLNEYEPSYGICDNYQQVLDRFPELVNSNRQFVLCLSKTEYSEHTQFLEKSGPYIGNDEPRIVNKEYFEFSVYEKIK